MISLDDSIRIYARASRAWFARNAAAQAAKRAEHCRACKDLQGVDVWLRVKAEVERLDAAGEPRRLPR